MAKKKAKKKTPKKSKVKAKQPLSNAKNKGCFTKGNKVAKGHKDPQAEMKKDFSQWFKQATTQQDILDVHKTLLDMAKNGSVKAAKEFLDRCMGKAPQSVNIEGNLDLRLKTVLGIISGNTKGILPTDDPRDSSNTS